MTGEEFDEDFENPPELGSQDDANEDEFDEEVETAPAWWRPAPGYTV